MSERPGYWVNFVSFVEGLWEHHIIVEIDFIL